MKQLNKYKSILTDFIFYLSILLFIIGFNFSDNMAGGWYQQFMPNLGGRQINDITFTDSLNGYAITNEVSDTSFILRTTNSGDNWFFSHFDTGICSYYNVQFINQSTGFVSGYIYDGSTFRIVKTTNSGVSWFYINSAFDVIAIDMFVLNQDTIWLTDGGSLVGGVFRTTNGGTSWDRQLDLGSLNPDHIYFFNGRIGFITKSTSGSYIRKTTDGGQSWFISTNNDAFVDMYFADSLTGWKAFTAGTMNKTTDGGLNWIVQILPQGGYINLSQVSKFSNINKDTIWGVGGRIAFPNNQFRGFIYKTTNGGNNWLFQLPDTSIHMNTYYSFIQFINKRIGWAYTTYGGIHTTTGGNDTFFTSVKQISSSTPNEFRLEQNYPNPFNPKTIISYELSRGVGTGGMISDVILAIYDIQGKHITDLVNQKQSAGKYQVDFSGNGYSSGVYFYSLIINGALVDTKKMVLLK